MIPYPWTPDWTPTIVAALVLGIAALVAWRIRLRAK